MPKKSPPTKFIRMLCRGLVGYISFLAPQRMSSVYSEHLLYGPIAQILAAKTLHFRAEAPVNKQKKRKGDFQRIDFLFILERESYRQSVGLEVKWPESPTIDLTRDAQKLMKSKSDFRFILVFGKFKVIRGLKAKVDGQVIKRAGDIVRFNAVETDYAATFYSV